MIKIVATLTEFGAAANIGGDPERKSVIIEIPEKNIPACVKDHLENENVRKWQTISLSFLHE